jgi:HK97 family phage major capsid protein
MSRYEKLAEELAEMVQERNTLLGEIHDYAERSEDLEGEDADLWNKSVERFETLEAEIPEKEDQVQRLRKILDAEERAVEAPQGVRRAPVPGTRTETPWDAARTIGQPSEVRSAMLTAIGDEPRLTDAEKESATRTLERYDNARGDLARHIAATGHPDYRTAFTKMVISGVPNLTPAEGHAIDFERAMSLTDASGGFAVPFLLDPTIIDISDNDGLAANMRQYARVERGVSDVWNGVTSNGVTFSWDAEAAEVSDDTPTFAQPSITAHKGAGFVPFSIEISQDFAGLESELRREMAIGKSNLEEAGFITGTGSGQPTGIVVALDGSASNLTSAGVGAFVIADVYSTFEGLPERFEGNATWMMNKAIADLIRQFDTAGGAGLWTTLGGGIPSQLLGFNAVTNPFMDATIATGDDVLVFGDFRNYVIYDRIGMTAELVPHLFATANNLPSGQRGIYTHFRVGADSVNDNGFRLMEIQ